MLDPNLKSHKVVIPKSGDDKNSVEDEALRFKRAKMVRRRVFNNTVIQGRKD